jgi:SAM-dependent methyltransferase
MTGTLGATRPPDTAGFPLLNPDMGSPLGTAAAVDGDYSAMAADYDFIMKGGETGEPYYDYAAIAGQLAAVDVPRVLELGAGTGLVLEALLDLRADYEMVTGVDLTPAMLAIARPRLARWPQVDLRQQDVTDLDLGGVYDIIWSYGGPWYLIRVPGGGYQLISHLNDDDRNARSLQRAAGHLADGGRFLLGVQGRHRTYSKPLGDGTVYGQWITPLEGGRFRKLYTRTGPDGAVMMRQVLDYQVYPPRDAMGLLSAAGLQPVAWRRQDPGCRFVEFARA